MKKFQLSLDTDSINLENEIHSNNFPIKVKNLAEHCVKYILGEHNTDNCNDTKYNREFHDQDIIPIPMEKDINNRDTSFHTQNTQKLFKQFFRFKEHNFKSSARKFLL